LNVIFEICVTENATYPWNNVAKMIPHCYKCL